MFNRIKSWLRGKPKPLLVDNMRIIPAFTMADGTVYYMHEDPMNTATGRGLTAMMFMEELLMRCSASYLRDHISAMEKIMDNKPSVSRIVAFNNMLKDRVNFLVALPEHVYKMATITFFTKDESPYRYDHALGERKIKEWMAEPDYWYYDFFLQTPLKDLIPSLTLPSAMKEPKAYLRAIEKINQQHLSFIANVLSKPAPLADL